MGTDCFASMSSKNELLEYNRFCLKNTMKAFGDFKNKQKGVRGNIFWYVEVCLFWKFVQYVIQWDKTHWDINFLQINGRKKCPLFFFGELQLITVLFLISCSYVIRLSKWVCNFKFCFGFIKVYVFGQQKVWTFWLWNITNPFKIKITEKRHTVLLPDLWFLNHNKKF